MQKIKDIITPELLQTKTKKFKLTYKVIAKETGCDKTNIAAWIKGLRPMANTTKNMFHWYFKCKEQEAREIEDAKWTQTEAEKYNDFKNGLSFGMK